MLYSVHKKLDEDDTHYDASFNSTSASVERIFSQVKLIVETTGVSPLEETLNTRVMERCNVY